MTPAAISESESTYIASGEGFSYTVSKNLGRLISIQKDGCELLRAPVALTVMRAPIDNERKIKSEWYKDSGSYYAEGFDRLFHKCYECTAEGSTVTVKGSLAAISRNPFLHYTASYTFFADGRMEVSLSGDVRENCIFLPRLGFEFSLDYENDAFRYFGRGDKENYCDMYQHTKVGYYDSSAKEEYVPYIMPQEHGNHTETKYLSMKGGLAFESDRGFEFSVSHYDAITLMRAMHTDELRELDATVVRIDYKASGVGSASCGPVLDEKYRLCEKHIEGFAFTVKP